MMKRLSICSVVIVTLLLIGTGCTKRERYTIREVTYFDDLAKDRYEGLSFHEGVDGTIYVNEFNKNNDNAYRTKAIYKFTDNQNKLTKIKNIKDTRVWDIKEYDGALYYTTVKFKGDYVTYQIVKEEKGTSIIQKEITGIELQRTPSLYTLKNGIFSFIDTIESKNNIPISFTEQFINLDTMQCIWKTKGNVNKYLLDSDVEQLGTVYNNQTESKIAFFTITTKNQIVYVWMNGKLTSFQENRILNDCFPTNDYLIVSYDNGYGIYDKDNKKIFEASNKLDIGRYKFVSNNTFLSIDEDGKSYINKVSKDGVESTAIKEIEANISTSFTKVNATKFLVSQSNIDEDTLKPETKTYMLDIT